MTKILNEFLNGLSLNEKEALARNIKYGMDTMDCNDPDAFFPKQLHF